MEGDKSFSRQGLVIRNCGKVFRYTGAIFLLLLLLGCQEEDQASKYIYYDEVTETVHCDRKCKKLNRKFKTRTQRVEIESIVDWRERDVENRVIQEFCPYCVSDEDYDFIMQSIQEQILEENE